ncbi:Endonuclease/Exonuclease/phosphatase family protein [Posidoniimonas corsicana]|uniref:Endonuclease/Exonuclease/phosphatase family protein n=1 Tax=Posidoniimonas corsicana TaxID=1938618 RepID=A0A5C5UUP2_9BACT|nr:endonuclease/exonuclease/phosphatase family protein [Posidoniimonas corsicana]TWT29347.1 Endonuclease/Exonuclease/phosphatase family protein [Posidoniimonas corsicana]
MPWFWIARLVSAFVVVATLLPLLPVGAWWVRVCDFPRLQLAAVSLLPVLLLAVAGGQAPWFGERGLLAAVCLLAFGWQLSHVVRYTGLTSQEVAHAPENAGQDSLRLVIANLEYTNDQKQAMLEKLRSTQPDVLLLIEFDDAWAEALAPLQQSLPHHSGTVEGEGLGLTLWSRLPLEDPEVRYLISERRPSIHTGLALPGGRSVRLICVHPTPPGLRDSTGEERRDSRVRDAELVVVADEVAKSGDTPCIVTGDFNDVAWSHTTRLFKRLSGLHDPRVGRGLYNTYPSHYPLLRFPIDHVFVSPGFQLRELSRIELPGSDHFGVIADVVPPAAAAEDPGAGEGDRQEAEEILEEGKQDAEQRDIKSDEADQHTLGAGRVAPRVV